MYAVIDTNVFVSAFITTHDDAATRRVYESIVSGDIIPIYNDEILAEYKEVLSRPRFKLESEDVDDLVLLIVTQGISSVRLAYEGDLIDPKDRVFYEVSLSVDDSFLVTGNLKHFPVTPRVVSPAEVMQLLDEEKNASKSKKE